jgi:hypothetical protein
LASFKVNPAILSPSSLSSAETSMVALSDIISFPFAHIEV